MWIRGPEGHAKEVRHASGLSLPVRPHPAVFTVVLLLFATPGLLAQDPPTRVESPVVVDRTPPDAVAGKFVGIDVVAINVVPTNFLKSDPVIAGQATKLKCVVYEYHPEGTNPDPVPWKGRIEAEGKVLATFSSEAAKLQEHLFDGDATMTSWAYDYEIDWTPAKPGWSETRCAVDVGNAVFETNETNNIKTSKALVDGPKVARLGDQPPPTAKAIPGGPPPITEAKLVTTSAALQPAQPSAGQKVKVLATVQNQGGLPSQNGLGLLLVCDQLPGEPKCPNPGPFATTLPGIPAGQTLPVTVYPEVTWPAGKYRLVVGTDVIGLKDIVELELIVKPTRYGLGFDPSGRYSGVRMREGEVQEENELGDPGGERSLNPQPEPPSADSQAAVRPGFVSAPGRPRGQVFAAPMWDGNRVDLCLVWGGQCGEPAANEFCKRSGYAKATAWKPSLDIGAQTPTAVLSSGQVCSDASCDGFASISCAQ